MPLTYSLRDIADFLLLGDGTAIVGGPMTEIYPGPAINPLRSVILSEDQIQELLDVADAAGLLGAEIDYGNGAMTATVADLPTTTVSVAFGGRSASQSAYGLVFEDEGSATVRPTLRPASSPTDSTPSSCLRTRRSNRYPYRGRSPPCHPRSRRRIPVVAWRSPARRPRYCSTLSPEPTS